MNKYTLEQFKKFSAEIEAFERGEEIEFKGEPYHWWILASNPTFDLHLEYRVKPKLTIEETTEKWVKDNDLKIGDKVRVTKGSFNGCVFEAEFISPISIRGFLQGFTRTFPVDYLEKITEEWIPFNDTDYDLFIGKPVKFKIYDSKMIIIASDKSWLTFCDTRDRHTLTYKEAFEQLEFADGTKFGKKI